MDKKRGMSPCVGLVFQTLEGPNLQPGLLRLVPETSHDDLPHVLDQYARLTTCALAVLPLAASHRVRLRNAVNAGVWEVLWLICKVCRATVNFTVMTAHLVETVNFTVSVDAPTTWTFPGTTGGRASSPG